MIDKNFAVVVFSCDKNKELWQPFFHCFNKYWEKDKPALYLFTETKKDEHFKTITHDIPLEKWTKRIRESLKDIQEEYIIFMCDDCFIRKPVDVDRIKDYITILKNDNNIALINFEKSFDERDVQCDFNQLKKRIPKSNYYISLLCGMWNKKNLIDILSEDLDPWEVEMKNDDKGYDVYINDGDYIIDWGYETFKPAGVFKGKWCREAAKFFRKENIEVNYNKKGFLKENNSSILSIIIPTYNNAKYLKKLLDELIVQHQYYPETEIIVVDDGSTEDMSFLDNISIITTIHIPDNHGVSYARNEGLDIAKGEFITFIDSDDMIESNYIKTIYEIMRNEKCDYCVFPWYIDDTGVHGIQHKEHILYNYAVWAYAFRADILYGIYFNENLNAGEDFKWLEQVILHKELNRYEHNEAIYKYNTQNETSITHKLNRGEIPVEKEKYDDN